MKTEHQTCGLCKTEGECTDNLGVWMCAVLGPCTARMCAKGKEEAIEAYASFYIDAMISGLIKDWKVTNLHAAKAKRLGATEEELNEALQKKEAVAMQSYRPCPLCGKIGD